MACLAAVLAVGCAAQTIDTYSGTATLVANGASAAEVSAQSIRLANCSTGVRPLPGTQMQTAPLPVLDLGDRCYFPGSWMSRGVFVGESGRTCVLPRAGTSDEVIRVTDVTARYQPAGRYVDTSVVDVRIGGDLIEGTQPPRHALFTFSGAFVASEGAGKRCLELVPDRIFADPAEDALHR